MTPGLTPDDRELIRAALGKVNKRIVLNILQKIEAGGIPTPREMEILNASTDTPQPSATAAATPADATPVKALPLQLESPDTPTGQAGVAQRYGVTVRTVKRWVAAGKSGDPEDPPPLHSPVDMKAWYERMRERGVFKHQPGPFFDQAIARLQASAPVPAPDAVAPAPADQLPDISDLNISLEDFDPSSIDFDDGVAMAKMNFKVQAAIMAKAFKANDHNQIKASRSAFIEALDLLRTVERDREKIMASSGKLLSRDGIRRELQSLHSNIANRFKTKLKESLTEMPTAIQSRETWAGFVERLVDEICRGLAETRFAEEKAA